MFPSATDSVVELMDGVQFRYTCPYCKKMPFLSCQCWRLSRKARLGGSVQGGQWAMPWCGKPWRWAT
eukprot:2382103-Lingulodinium_polyedra.AAC.1